MGSNIFKDIEFRAIEIKFLRGIVSIDILKI
jgi:hypothetical protein